jgi:hypothetical protein
LKELTANPKIKLEPLIVGASSISGLPSRNSWASTVSSESSDSVTSCPKSTSQFTVIAEPLRIVSLPVLLETVTEGEAGTVETDHEFKIIL